MYSATLTIDIHRIQPPWVSADLLLNKNAYRLYVNDELLTERTWSFGDDLYVKEHIVLDSDNTNYNYTLKVLSAGIAPYTKFILKNLTSATEINQEVLNENTIVFNFK